MIVILAGCASKYTFAFSYKLDKNEYGKGDRAELSATIKNESGATYKYIGASSDFTPTVYLYCEGGADKYEISIESPPSTTDVGTFTIKDGESVTRYFYFDIPSDAPTGEYSLKMSYLNNEAVFENVLTIV